MADTASALTENKAFAERIFDRIKDGLGDLMTDEELKILLNRAVHEAFFKDRTVPNGYNGTRQEPAYFVQMTRDLLQKEVQAQVTEYFEANREALKEKVAEVLQQGIGEAVLKAISYELQAPLFSLQSSLSAKGLL
jgi:hypothetical protein